MLRSGEPGLSDPQGHLLPATAGKTVLQIADYPGMLIWRTVAISSMKPLMRFKKAWPLNRISNRHASWGELSIWPTCLGSATGWQRILRLLENLQHHYGEERIAHVHCCANGRFWRAVMSHRPGKMPMQCMRTMPAPKRLARHYLNG